MRRTLQSVIITLLLIGFSGRHVGTATPVKLLAMPKVKLRKVLPKRQKKRKYTKADFMSRWYVGRAEVVSFRLDRISCIVSRAAKPETIAKTYWRYKNQLRLPVLLVTTGLFFDKNRPSRPPVGATVFPDGTKTCCNHPKKRGYLVMPQKGKMYRVSNRFEVPQDDGMSSFELGPPIYPKIVKQAGLSEPDWLTRRTERYLIAFRGKYELLIIHHPCARPIDLQRICAKLSSKSNKVTTGDLLDGGSVIPYGSPYHLVIVALSRLV